MSRKHETYDRSFPDTKLDEDKLGDFSSNQDSGFLSGEIVSGEISQEIIAQEIVREISQEQSVEIDNSNQMRLDSGVDLSDNFSELKLKSAHLNDLGCTTLLKDLNLKEEPLVEFAQDDVWQEWFQQDEDGDTLLHIAIIQNALPVVLALVKGTPYAPLLDTPNDHGQTPMHFAVSTGQWKIVRLLKMAGAKPQQRDHRGDSPLHMATRNGDLKCCMAITTPVPEEARQIIGLRCQQPCYPVDLDQWNYEGQTCVHLAAIEGHIDVLRHLVCSGADINARDGRQGFSALHYSIQRGDELLANYLLTECDMLNTDAVTYGGDSALQLGYPVASSIESILRSKGVASPYSSDDEYSDEEYSKDEIYDNTTSSMSYNLVGVSS